MRGKVDPEGVEVDHLRRLIDLRGARILEIGCGDGRLTASYASQAAHAVGIDIKAASLVSVRSAMPADARIDFLVADARSLPYLPATFDAVLFARSL